MNYLMIDHDPTTNIIVLEATAREADVFGYNQKVTPRRIPIISGATALKDQRTGDTYILMKWDMYILIFHESLYYGTELNHLLINCNNLFE